MAGTMPHAIFVETGLEGGSTVAAYAAELPGCATFAATDREAVLAMPRRVVRFCEWLRRNDEPVMDFVGDNWYEVERAAADASQGGRAAFSLDELPPSDEEWGRWLRWLELAREELAESIDRAGIEPDLETRLAAMAAQDVELARSVGGDHPELDGDSLGRFYRARDALLKTLEERGHAADGVRRALRLAIADDLRLAARLGGSAD